MSWKRKLSRFLKNSRDPVLFLINIRGKTDAMAYALARILKKYPVDHLIILFHIKKPSVFDRADLNVCLSEDYLSRVDYEAIDNIVCEEISRRWYRYQGMFQYDKIHLGSLVEYDFQKYLIPRLKNLEILRRITRRYPAHRLVVLENTGELRSAVRCVEAPRRQAVFIHSFRRQTRFFSFYSFLKNLIASRLSACVDAYARQKIYRARHDAVLMDARLYHLFKPYDETGAFVPSPLEKGLRVRLKLLKRQAYFPIYMASFKYRRFFKKQWQALKTEQAFQDYFVYKNQPVWKLVEQELKIYFLRRFPGMMSNFEMLAQFYHKNKIKMIVVRNDQREYEKTLIYSARLANIPSLVVQDGILAETNGHDRLVTDQYAGWGPLSARWYHRAGNSTSKIAITGNPKFDVFYGWRPDVSKERLYHRLGLDRRKGFILFVTQRLMKFSSFWTDDLFLTMTEGIVKTMKTFSDKQLVIKIDPYERLSDYSDFKNDFCAIVKDFDLKTLLYYADAVVTFNSTVGLEAMIFDKPVIAYNPTKRRDLVQFESTDAAFSISDAKQLPSAIHRVLSDDDVKWKMRRARKQFIGDHAYQIDGQAHQRILRMIKRHVEQ